MLFQSGAFLLLLTTTLGIVSLFPRSRVPVLAAANAIFYGVAGWQYLLVFLGASALTYACSLHVRKSYGRWLLWAGVLNSAALLGYFKYAGFLAVNLDRMLKLGLEARVGAVILPVGISFYTFQLVAYLVDVYRGTAQPARSLLHFWVFIAFFGQLIAGPIMRAGALLPQVEQGRAPRTPGGQVQYGVYLFALGMAKKVLLADNLGPLTDRFFGQAAQLGSLEAWIAAYLFGFQIYLDFSAYSDMALGIGRMFGLHLTVNFRTPYLAGNPAEFWQRWHITLSSWIRDYIYIPLGGSRRGELRTCLNLVAAMALSGLWHGAAWTFVIWGLFHGALSLLHRLYARLVIPRLGIRLQGAFWRWVSVGLMFHATVLGWVFFRATGTGDGLVMLRRMLLLDQVNLTRTNLRYLILIGVLYLLHIAEFWFRRKERELDRVLTRRVPAPLRAALYAAFAAALLLATRTEQIAFIYFRF